MTDSRHSGPSVADRIDALLPQTQCGQCGYRGCRPYAEAIAAGQADINRCPPGGHEGVEKLARLLGRESKPLNPECGVEKPRQLARVVEDDCIGCTKCIQACPVDAIVGAPKRMHTVIADRCTGCELCVPACPVDCIVLTPMPELLQDKAHADAARAHFEQHETRLARERMQREAQLARRKASMHKPAARTEGPVVSTPLSHSAVQAAIERARAKRAARGKLRP